MDTASVSFDFPTIAAALDTAARGDRGVRFHDGHGAVSHVLSYRDLREAALAVAVRLAGCGLVKGDRIGVIAETRPEFLAVFYGCQYAGVIPCPLPHRSIFGGAAFIETTVAMLRAGKIQALIALPQQAGLEPAAAEAGSRLLAYADLLNGPEGSLPAPPSPDDIAYIQFSSGSTARPKGIVITQRAISSNAAAILSHGLRLTSRDRAFSWLPLYHDMGLVGFSISPIYGNCAVDYLPALAFARRPVLWLRLMATYGSTITYSPSFGYRLAAQRYGSEPENVDLSRLRIAGIGGDMIRADVLAEFTDAMRKTGFDRKAFLPSYGMAEATLAVSFGRAGEGFETDCIDRDLADRTGRIRIVTKPGKARTRTFVSCGFPLPGTDLAIVDDRGDPLPDWHIGRILIRGANLMRGYADDARRTAEVMRPDGFLDSGDIGYRRRGQVVVTGRVKDVIPYRGRNIWPEDIEWTAERAAALNHGDAVAFSVENPTVDDAIVVLVHARRTEERQLEALRDSIHRAVSQALGVSCEIVFVRPGSLPKTSSGKLARARARELYLQQQSGDHSSL